MTIQDLGKPIPVPLSVLSSPEQASKVFGYNLPFRIRQMVEEAEDLNLTIDWSTFQMAVDTSSSPHMAVIDITLHAS